MRFKLRKQDAYPLRERIHKAEAGAIISAFLPETPENQKPVAEKLAIDKGRQELGPIAGHALANGDEERFLYFLAFCGPKLLTEPSVAERLHWRWLQARWHEQPEGEAARQFFKHIGQALSWGPRGQHAKLPEAKRQEHEKTQAYKDTTQRNHRRTAKRLAAEITAQAIRNQNHGRSPQQAREEAVRCILGEWKETSSAKDKPAILALVKEFLADNCQGRNIS